MVNTMDIYSEFEKHLMEDQKPSEYFNSLLLDGSMYQVYPFTMIGDLAAIQQAPKHHPEGSVWNHTMMVIDNAAMVRNHSKDPKVLMWSALLHDIGKAPTTKIRKGRITSYDHDKWGQKLSIKFLSQFTDDQEFIKRVSRMVRWHMQSLFVVQKLPFAQLDRMIEEVPIEEISLLCLCDRLGRGGIGEEKSKEVKKDIEYFTLRANLQKKHQSKDVN